MKKIILVILGITFAVGVLFAVKLQSFYNQIQTKRSGASTAKPQEKASYNLLLLGYGGGSHEGTYLTDTMMIVHIDTKKKTVDLISLPRDLWVQLPTKSGADFHTKINSVYEIGLYPQTYPDVKTSGTDNQAAADLVIDAVTRISGVPIDYYAAIDFAGFRQAIDLLGGVDINVSKTFDDYQYPIDGKENDLCGRDDEFKQIEQYLAQPGQPTLTPDQQTQRDQFFKDHQDLEKFFKDITDSPQDAFPCRYEHLHFDAGPQHMNGETALKYARSRHSIQDGTDFGRAARQQKVIQAVKEKVFTIGFIPKIIPLMDEMKTHIRTDLDFNLIKKFTAAAQKKENYTISSAVPDDNQLQNSYSDVGGSILIPTKGADQWGDMQTWVQNVIAGITPTPTQTAPNASVSGTIRSR